MNTTNNGRAYADTTELQTRKLKAGTVARLITGDRYSVLVADLGGGLLLANGNYANLIETTQTTTNETDITNFGLVIPQTVSGVLTTGGRLNQIRDSGAFDFPLAASVPANTILVVELPDKYKAQTPSITRSGTDTITNGDGTDTVINFVGAVKLTLTSDGVSDWSY